MVDVPRLPSCPFNGKMSFPTKHCPPEMRVWRDGGKKHGYITMYKCKHCPYFHQTKS